MTMSPTEIERALKGMNVPADKARAVATGTMPAPAIGAQRVTQKPASGDRLVLGRHSRIGDELRLELFIAPRTKKNGRKGGFGGIKQGDAYRTYRDAIVRAFADAHTRATLALPMPMRAYNIAVTYYVDRYGKTADKCGLDQGLYDALENAGVVVSDWYFRTDDGTRIVVGETSPRVDLIITPLEEGAHG